MGKDIERMLTQLPKVPLSTERDRLIRQAITSSALVPESCMRNWFTMPRLSVAVASVLVALAGVGGYAAYAAPTVTRGDALYGVKRSIERVSGFWQRTPLQRVRFHSDLALRRLSELEVLLSERGRAGGIALIAVAYAQTPSGSSANASTSEPITATATEVIAETRAAGESAQQIIEPMVARQAVRVLETSQAHIADRLTAAAGTTGTSDAAVVDAIAQAIEVVRQVATSTAVAATEVEVAVKRGEREVHVTIVIRREVEDAAEVREDLVEQRQGLAELRAKLTVAGVPGDEGARLLERIGDKLDQVEAAIAAGNLHQAEGLLEAAEALRKNAKHFLKAVEREEERQQEASEQVSEAQAAIAKAESALTALRAASPEADVSSVAAALDAARAKLGEAEAALGAEDPERIRSLAKVAEGLADRVEDRIEAVEERLEEEAERVREVEERAREDTDRVEERARKAEEKDWERSGEATERERDRAPAQGDGDDDLERERTPERGRSPR